MMVFNLVRISKKFGFVLFVLFYASLAFATIQPLIFVAEDNLVNQQIIRRYLSTTSYEWVIAKDGLEIVDLVRQFEKTDFYIMVLMDAQMPNLDGFGALSQINQLKFKYRPYLVAFSNNEELSLRMTKEYGAHFILSKDRKTTLRNTKGFVAGIDTIVVNAKAKFQKEYGADYSYSESAGPILQSLESPYTAWFNYSRSQPASVENSPNSSNDRTSVTAQEMDEVKRAFADMRSSLTGDDTLAKSGDDPFSGD